MAGPSADGERLQPPQDVPASSPAPPEGGQPGSAAPASAAPRERLQAAAQARQQLDEEPEEELWQGGYSSKAMIGSWLTAAFVTVLTLVLVIMFAAAIVPVWLVWLVLIALLWGWLVVQFLYRKWTFTYRLTTQRFIHESGLLRRVTDRIEVIDIDDVSFEQRVVERIMGVGTIKILSSDRSHPALTLRGIERVRDVAGLIDDTRRKERRRRGLHIESI